MWSEAAVSRVAGGPAPALAPGCRRRSSALVVAALALVTAFSPLFSAGVRSQAPTRVLFVGNSYTYFHNLPEMVVKLAAARRQKVEARMVAPGGWRLKDHWERRGSSSSVLPCPCGWSTPVLATGLEARGASIPPASS
jgi:hypothetical protein